MDLVISLEIIADEEKNSTFASVLEREGYLLGDKESDKRWKFLKETEEGKRVIVELHSPAPDNRSKRSLPLCSLLPFSVSRGDLHAVLRSDLPLYIVDSK